TPVPSTKLTDYHRTTIDLLAAGKLESGNRFVLEIKRVDDLVSPTGAVLAEKLVDVIVGLDVTPSGAVLVNDRPAPMGVSNIRTTSAVLVGLKNHGHDSGAVSRSDLLNAFDVGMVELEVHAYSWPAVIGGVEGSRVLLAEKLTEINGKKVEQSGFVHQVFEIEAGKSVKRISHGYIQEAELLAMKENMRTRGCHGRMRARLSAWWHSLSTLGKFAIATLAGGIALSIALALIQFILVISGFTSPADDEDAADESPFLEKVSMGGKAYLVVAQVDEESETDGLPAYTTDGYAAVALEEEKKEEQ
ncbi:hypothetical protein BDK51DRAFT_52114, partial [Blyttiomyces helicus]